MHGLGVEEIFLGVDLFLIQHLLKQKLLCVVRIGFPGARVTGIGIEIGHTHGSLFSRNG